MLCIVHVTHVPMVMQSRMVAKGTKAPNGEEAYARHDDAHQDRGECVHSRDISSQLQKATALYLAISYATTHRPMFAHTLSVLKMLT